MGLQPVLNVKMPLGEYLPPLVLSLRVMEVYPVLSPAAALVAHVLPPVVLLAEDSS